MMTPERLAEIRAASGEGSADWSDPITDARELLAEVERLRAEVAAAWDDGYEKGWQDGSIDCTTPWENPHALASGDEVQP